MADALLAITDSRQRASSRATIVKAYKTVRGSAVKHVKAALPALGQLVQDYMLALPAGTPRGPARGWGRADGTHGAYRYIRVAFPGDPVSDDASG